MNILQVFTIIIIYKRVHEKKYFLLKNVYDIDRTCIIIYYLLVCFNYYSRPKKRLFYAMILVYLTISNRKSNRVTHLNQGLEPW